MSITGDRIKEQRTRLQLRQQDLATALGLSKQAILKYEKGLVDNIPGDHLIKLAALFGVSPIYLLGWEQYAEAYQSTAQDGRMAALLRDLHPLDRFILPKLEPENHESAPSDGVYFLAEEDDEVELPPVNIEVELTNPAHQVTVAIPYDTEANADFCMTMDSDALIDLQILRGDTLFVKKMPLPDDGDVSVVLIDRTVIVRRVHFDREAGILTLLPANPAYRELCYEGAELAQVRILGKVVYIQRALD